MAFFKKYGGIRWGRERHTIQEIGALIVERHEELYLGLEANEMLEADRGLLEREKNNCNWWINCCVCYQFSVEFYNYFEKLGIFAVGTSNKNK